MYLNMHFSIWSGTSYSRTHFLPFTRDDRGYAHNTPFIQFFTYTLAIQKFYFVRFSFFLAHSKEHCVYASLLVEDSLIVFLHQMVAS